MLVVLIHSRSCQLVLVSIQWDTPAKVNLIAALPQSCQEKTALATPNHYSLQCVLDPRRGNVRSRTCEMAKQSFEVSQKHVECLSVLACDF